MKSMKRNNDKMRVIDVDESDQKGNYGNKDKTKNSRTADLEVRKKRFNGKMKNEVIIDDDDEEIDIIVENTVEASNKKRKGSDEDEAVATKRVHTTRETSTKSTSKRKKFKEDVNEDSNGVVKFESGKKTERKRRDKISVNDPDKLNCKVKVIDEEATGTTSYAVTGTRKKRLDRKTDVGEKRSPTMDVVLLSKNEIIIEDQDDDEDIKVETTVDEVKKRKRRLNDIVPAKRVKIDKASSSKQKLEIDQPVELSDDGSEESIDVVEYRSKKKTERKRKDERTVIDLDKLDRKGNSRDKDAGTSKTTASKEAKKEIKNKIEVRKEEESSDSDIASLPEEEPEEEVTVITDDEDTEDVKLETIVPVKRGNEEKASVTEARRAETSTLKKKSENKQEGESPSAQKSKKKQTKNNIGEKLKVEWSECDYLCEFNQIDQRVAENLVSLFKDENTIPFIARYRKEMTGGMEPEQLRSIRNSYDNLKLIKNKALSILKSIDKLGKWDPEIYSDVMAAKTMHDLELIYAPFKLGGKRTFAERARKLGLAPVCEDILQGRPIPHFDSFIDPKREGLRNVAEVRQSIMHIIADVISKNKTTHEAILWLRTHKKIYINSTISKTASSSAKTTAKNKPSESDLLKFKIYFDFSAPVTSIRDYQILAINRGEELKILSVNISYSEWFVPALKSHCLKKYRFVRKISQVYWDILEESFDDAYVRLIKFQITRQVRHELSERAESASIAVFTNNLKNLLLTPPLRGKTVLGIDPGFINGCKLAVVSPCGDILDSATIYPHCETNDKQVERLPDLVKKHNCTVVALGNATACRETEQLLDDMIRNGVFAPIDLSYTIINESGASIYSCSKEAKTEFPKLDPNIISAVSIARRLQDPLAELVKVEPKHLGIGMYQHDLPEKRLQLTLNEVISETVSFVGVDVNTASQCLLKRVAGLNETRAAKIINHRNNCGPFTNREQLLEVCGIGPKSYEQCAGFIRILPETASTRGALSPAKKCPLNYLDQTWIHPESYEVARQFLKACGCSLKDLGTDNFIDKILSYGNNRGRKILAEEFGTSETTMDIIINGLSMKKGDDIRINRDAPLFHRYIRRMDDLRIGQILTGFIRNVTDFGAFTDIGIGTNGLIPIPYMKGQILSLGQRVEVSVISIDKVRERITLSI